MGTQGMLPGCQKQQRCNDGIDAIFEDSGRGTRPGLLRAAAPVQSAAGLDEMTFLVEAASSGKLLASLIISLVMPEILGEPTRSHHHFMQ